MWEQLFWWAPKEYIKPSSLGQSKKCMLASTEELQNETVSLIRNQLFGSIRYHMFTRLFLYSQQIEQTVLCTRIHTRAQNLIKYDPRNSIWFLSWSRELHVGDEERAKEKGHACKKEIAALRNSAKSKSKQLWPQLKQSFG